MSIRWITPQLGTGPALEVLANPDISAVDVRDLVDKDGNRAEAIREKISQACALLKEGRKTVICCDYGISRSNSIAVGVLAAHEGISFSEAVRRVVDATGETDIKAGPLRAVRLAVQDERRPTVGGKKRILVTGGSGFLGRRLLHRLEREAEVLAPPRLSLDMRAGSTSLDMLAGEYAPDTILHLASPRIYTSNSALGDTLSMLRNVMDVCVAHDIRLVFMSSWEVYSGYRGDQTAGESLPMLPKGPYAETKYLCETLIAHSRKTQGLRCGILRSGPVYGPGSDKPKFVYNFIDKIRQGRPVMTHTYNNGVPALDLLYLDDIVEAIAAMSLSDSVETFNIGTGVATPTRDVAALLAQLMGKTIEIGASHIDADVARIAMCSNRARETLGWRPRVSLEKGLQGLISQFDGHDRGQ